MNRPTARPQDLKPSARPLRLNWRKERRSSSAAHPEELSKIATSYGFMRKGRIIEQLFPGTGGEEPGISAASYAGCGRSGRAAGGALCVRSYRIVSASELQITERSTAPRSLRHW
ncbi:MAG: hypothetical protein ACLVJ6_01030 [Merdibacter sp.]